MKPFTSFNVVRHALPLAAAALFSFGPGASAGTHTWSGLGVNGNFSDPQNWSYGGAPSLSERTVELIFPAFVADKNPTVNIDGLPVTRLEIQGGGYFLNSSGGAKLHLGSLGDTIIADGTSTFHSSLGLVLSAPTRINVSTIGQLIIEGVISGTNSLTKIGDGELLLSGATANTCSGTVAVEGGVLALQKSSGVAAVAGPLVIGHEAASALPRDVVEVRNTQQIADTVPVTLRKTGMLKLINASESVASLNMTGGDVEAGLNMLTLLGNVTCSAPKAEGARINGYLSLGAFSRFFIVEADCHLRIDAAVSGLSNVGLIKQGAGTLELTAANTYPGMTTIGQGELLVSGAGTTLGATTGGTVVASGAQLVLSWVDIGDEALTLNGDGPGTNSPVVVAHGDCSWAGPISFAGAKTNTFDVLTVALALNGPISGSGDLRMVGHNINGTWTRLELNGTSANTYNGLTMVDIGRLHLGKTAGLAAVPHELNIGLDSNIAVLPSATVALMAPNQIVDNAPVLIRATGRLDLGDFNESIALLNLYGGVVDTDAGTLTLLSAVYSDATFPTVSGINGKLSLGGQTRTFTVETQTELVINAIISGTGTAGLTKQGGGHLDLHGANTYPGITTVAAGFLNLAYGGQLGSTAAGTIVNNGAFLDIDNTQVGNESLQLNGIAPAPGGAALNSHGNSSWAGPITLNGSDESVVEIYSGTLALNGSISGTGGFRPVGLPGTKLILGGSTPNIFQGPLAIYAGNVVFAKTAGAQAVSGILNIGTGFPASVTLSNANQIADLSQVIVGKGSELNLNNNAETVGSLEGAGSVITQFAALTAGGNNFSTTFSGSISGVGIVSLIKQGTGWILFTGTNYSTGRTLINGGKIYAHGKFLGPVWVNATGTLGGNGEVGAVAATNGVVSPGAGAGILEVKNVAFNSGSTLRIELNGKNPGQYDQLKTVGTVNLGNAVLQTSLGYAGTVSNQFVIIDNDGADAVVGTFAGLAEGATMTMDGAQFKISYVGGTGNDVVLTQITSVPKPQFSQIQRLPNGTIQLSGTGTPGTVYQVHANDDLNTTNWVNLGPITADSANGSLQFVDPNAAQFPQRFYRFVLP